MKKKEIVCFRSRLPDGKPEKIKDRTLISALSKAIYDFECNFKIKNRYMLIMSPDTEIDLYLNEMRKGNQLITKRFKYWITA